MYKFLVKLFLKLHSLSYRLVSIFAIKAEVGLHPKHRLMNYHKFFVDHIEPTNTVLDIGCGNGVLASDIANKAKHVVAIDNQDKNMNAWKMYVVPNLEFLVADATSFSSDQTFDVIVLSNVLEHIEQRTEFLQNIKHLAPKFLIRIPMVDRDWVTLYKKELGLEYRLDKTHYTEYTLSTFKKELSLVGLIIQEYSIQFGEIWAVVNPL